MESMTFASWKEWRRRGRERREGACRGRFLVVLGLEDFLLQTEARYWPEILSHCCRKDENMLSSEAKVGRYRHCAQNTFGTSSICMEGHKNRN